MQQTRPTTLSKVHGVGKSELTCVSPCMPEYLPRARHFQQAGIENRLGSGRE
jgi:hypothetical protein